MRNNVILNYLPPSDTGIPSPALSILKSFIAANGFPVDVTYWNLLFDEMLLGGNDLYTEEFQIKLLPFCSIIADELDDPATNNRIISNINSLFPQWVTGGRDVYHNWLEETKVNILVQINRELDKIDFENVVIYGISSKFFQWIPGYILAREVKKRNPDVKIVIGGFESRNGAYEILNICSHIDFAIWGEGEYPLLELCKQLQVDSQQFDSVPRLIYKEKQVIRESPDQRSSFLDFGNYLYPDYSDYYRQNGNRIDRLPINAIRGCIWRKCKFCNYNMGYKYREREPACIVKEIKEFSQKYNCYYFTFVDNDNIGKDIAKFDELLDRLIELNTNSGGRYTFWAQLIVHKELNYERFEKLAAAGFSQISGGYEAISESILKKMDKSNSLSHNILFIKGTQKYGINCPVNLLKGIPDETIEDVHESIGNLHYFRFFFGDLKFPLKHLSGFFNLKKEAKYFSLLTEEEKSEYVNNSIAYNLPASLSKDRFNLFGYAKNEVANGKAWSNLYNIEQFYLTNRFSYTIDKVDNGYQYTEFCNDSVVGSVEFDEMEYISVLLFATQKVTSFDSMFGELVSLYPDLTEDRLKEILDNLQDEFLIYCNDDKSTIISIIDVAEG